MGPHHDGPDAVTQMTTRVKGRGAGKGRRRERCEEVPGIVIADGTAGRLGMEPPRIAAFIWGGKVRPSPTLPYGRWREVV